MPHHHMADACDAQLWSLVLSDRNQNYTVMLKHFWTSAEFKLHHFMLAWLFESMQ